MTRMREFFRDLDNIDSQIVEITTKEYPFPTTPQEFIESAELDLKTELPQATSNSLANSKRALDSQLDHFFIAYGLDKLAENKKWQAGKKIQVVGGLGLVPNRILFKVNETRNALEHKYERPSYQTAVNAVDIVGLFIAAMDSYLCPVHNSAAFYNLVKDQSAILSVASEGSIDVSCFNGKADWLTLSSQHPDDFIRVNAVSQSSHYLYLLTFLLHYRRFYMPNCSKFFQGLKYLTDNQSGDSNN